MKKFVFFILLIAGFFYWFEGWVASGQMDAFIAEHKNRKYTPVLLKTIAEGCFIAQEHKSASTYYRWVIEEYPKDREIPKLRWQLGQCYEEIHRKDLALEQYEILKDSYSQTEYGQLASNRYGNLRY